jgi:hypothetical protein
VLVDRVEQIEDALAVRVVATRVLRVQRLERRTTDDRDVVAGELVGAQQLADFHLDELEQLLVVDLVDLLRNTTIAGTPT